MGSWNTQRHCCLMAKRRLRWLWRQLDKRGTVQSIQRHLDRNRLAEHRTFFSAPQCCCLMEGARCRRLQLGQREPSFQCGTLQSSNRTLDDDRLTDKPPPFSHNDPPANGKVLVAGGYDGDTHASMSSAELYDPATGTWAATGLLRASRDSHTATLLPNGKVLVTGGFDGNGDFSGAELYDPATGRGGQLAH